MDTFGRRVGKTAEIYEKKKKKMMERWMGLTNTMTAAGPTKA